MIRYMPKTMTNVKSALGTISAFSRLVKLKMRQETHMGLQVKCPYCCPILPKTGMYEHILVRIPISYFVQRFYGCWTCIDRPAR